VYVFDRCEILLNSARLNSGVQISTRNSCKTLKCPQCNWHYKYQETLEIHMREKHPDGESACGYCLAGRLSTCNRFNDRFLINQFPLISQAPPIHALHVASPIHAATNHIAVKFATIQRPQKAISRSTCRVISI
jgi:hypothetical protein